MALVHAGNEDVWFAGHYIENCSGQLYRNKELNSASESLNGKMTY